MMQPGTISCDKCKEKASYEVTIREGMKVFTRHYCFSCYKKSQTETIIDVKILK